MNIEEQEMFPSPRGDKFQRKLCPELWAAYQFPSPLEDRFQRSKYSAEHIGEVVSVPSRG